VSCWNVYIYYRNVVISLRLDVIGSGRGLIQSIMNTGYGDVFKSVFELTSCSKN
jgi:hypothetical protein